MTLIIGIVDPKTKDVYMGADSAGVNGWFQIQSRADRKLFQKGGMIFGGAGSFRAIQAVRSNLSIQKPREGVDIYEYIMSDVLEPLRTTLRTAGCLKREHDVETTEGVFMIGYRGHLYTIHSDLQVAETERSYATLGCADDLARGFLFACETFDWGTTTKSMMRACFDAGAAFSAGVRGPFWYTSEKLVSVHEL